MNGKLLCFIDNLIAVEQDSLAIKTETTAYDRNLNLNTCRYGLRINTDLVMDLQCDLIPIVVGGNMDNPKNGIPSLELLSHSFRW